MLGNGKEPGAECMDLATTVHARFYFLPHFKPPWICTTKLCLIGGPGAYLEVSTNNFYFLFLLGSPHQQQHGFSTNILFATAALALLARDWIGALANIISPLPGSQLLNGKCFICFSFGFQKKNQKKIPPPARKHTNCTKVATDHII